MSGAHGVVRAGAVIHVRVHLPIVDEKFDADLAEVAFRLTTEELRELLSAEGQELDSWVVHKVLRRLQKTNAELSEGYADYLARYRRVNRRLVECRGYGFDGDEEPTLQFEVEEVRSWMVLNRPRMLSRACC